MKTDLNKIIAILKTKYKDYLQSNLVLTEDIYTIIQCIRPEYRLFIFNEIKDLLNDKEYVLALKYAYTKTSGINTNESKLSTDEVLYLFKNANLKELIGVDYKRYIKLPDIVNIYRGTSCKANYNAISWTIDRNRAIWFYKKYKSKGTVYKAKIKKQDIICYLDKSACLEKEVIVNYKNIFSLEELPKEEIDRDINFSFEDEGTVNTDYVINASQHILQSLVNFGVFPTKELATELFKSYQTQGKYKSNYVIKFFTGEEIILHELLEKIE